MNTTAQHTTIVTATNPAELSPIEAAIMDACNVVHEARAGGDSDRVRTMKEVLLDLLERYDATEAENHPNAAWARPNQRALVMSALGDVNEAIRLERLALRYADTPRRREISHGNLADRCIRAGRPLEAVDHFLRAWEIAPDSTPVMITGAQALFLAGMREEADAIFASFLDRPEHLRPESELTAYLDFETRLHEMADELPSLGRLMRLWRSIRPN